MLRDTLALIQARCVSVRLRMRRGWWMSFVAARQVLHRLRLRLHRRRLQHWECVGAWPHVAANDGALSRARSSIVAARAHRVPRHISVAAPARSPPSGRPALFGRRYLRAEPIDGVVGVYGGERARHERRLSRVRDIKVLEGGTIRARPAPAVSWCRAGVAGERARTWRASMGPTERSPVNERAGWHDEWVE